MAHEGVTGIIGGSGLYAMEDLDVVDEVDIMIVRFFFWFSCGGRGVR